eukprot:GHVH01001144.1.p1 GENE.GHVH01001144.1~~GHVH01001144.1.p1  ORF type:complete len:1033 (+),score=171.95 GHVH01001144.1:64-3162(+)
MTTTSGNELRKRPSHKQPIAESTKKVKLGKSQQDEVSVSATDDDDLPVVLLPIESIESGDFVSEVYEGGTNCIHHCVRNREDVMVAPKPIPTPMAKSYAYELDVFQHRAVLCLENNESVLVAAHTSAGKTTVAEYAIAMSFRDDESVIYTSPIKALSNQKFRDLQEEFGPGNVGLLTGDVSVNPTARVMVMTTEILRSMLYRGSEITRQVKWVIFDEVHYMNDRERGVVWEETMILLPDTVRYVFLSATIPNSDEFAGWIASIKHQPCHTIFTDYRPVPLQHYVHTQGCELYLVVDQQKRFQENLFQQAIISTETKLSQMQTSKEKDGGNVKDLEELIAYGHKNLLTPMIVFQFSKKTTETNARGLSEAIDLTTDDEKESIVTIFNGALETLSGDDKELPQINGMLGLLQRGIGLHHGGLLPIVKELVELLFGEGLLKVLFATETFAMGVNMPARTVVFADIKKFDGETTRLMSGGEYIQMSGRAGRRNVDDQGKVIVMMTQKMEPEDAKEVFTGAANRLESQFRLTYSMILNTLRLARDQVKPQWIIERSFKQFQVNRSASALELQKKRLQKSYAELPSIPYCDIDDEDQMIDDVTDYFGLVEDVRKVEMSWRQAMLIQSSAENYLVPGRIVELEAFQDGKGLNYGHAVIISRLQFMNGNKFDMTLTVLVEVKATSNYVASAGEIPDIQYYQPTEVSSGGTFMVLRCNYRYVKRISTITANKGNIDFTDENKKRKFGKTILKLSSTKDLLKYITLADLVENELLDSDLCADLVTRMNEATAMVEDHRLNTFEQIKELLSWVEERKQKRMELTNVTKRITDLRASILEDELNSRMKVLQDMEYIDVKGTLLTKGRIACNISTADELIVSEMLMQGHFNDMSPEESCAVLSALLFDEQRAKKANNDDISSPRLVEFYTKLKELSSYVAEVSTTNRMPDEVCKKITGDIQPNMMDFTLEWAEGYKSFKELMELHGDHKKLYEGNVVRLVRRLEELLRQLCSAAKSMENDAAYSLFMSAIQKVKKGIIFAASLYL